MVMIMPMTLIHFQFFDISLVGAVGRQVFIHFDGNILKSTLFEQGADRLFTDLHMLDMLQTNMDNGVFFQTIHGPKIELIDTSDMVQPLQITLDLLDIYSFWHGIQENLERAPKTWNGFGQNKEEYLPENAG